MKKIILISLLFSALILAGCSSSDNNDEPESVVTPDPILPISFTLSSDDQMKFEQTEFQVVAEQQVSLTLSHIGSMSKNAMGHNIVILKPGTDLAAFTNEAASSMQTDYIPESFESSIIAHSRMLGGGESASINFSIETPDVYTFICSFPGHYAVMQGTITVE
ncbi:Azurin [Bizionia argentinensis JUB59]|uniref:Azurin n=1 Tax=Bizionia argentinensis JUB59 TaxID=1046627 RepID=G2EAM2_9FLAO|nr:azurin [Bizionia argentinensis]EGV44513.1 Azurin [Bizionia argentinensis JUB59]